jgi:hypothetical protein
MGSSRRRFFSFSWGGAAGADSVFLLMKLPSRDFSVFFSAIGLSLPSKFGLLLIINQNDAIVNLSSTIGSCEYIIPNNRKMLTT